MDTSSPSPSRISELVALVAAEARLDLAVVAAREAAEAIRAAARQRAEVAAATLDDELARERTRIAAEIAGESATQLRAIEESARVAIARFDAVRGDLLAPLARALAVRLVAIAIDEAP